MAPVGTAIDLNADVGEGLGPWPMGADEELIPLVSSVNVACGAHAGDPSTILRTVRWRCAGIAVGAHPGYPDLVGFGRRALDDGAPTSCEASSSTRSARRAGRASRAGGSVRHVKPHGALYNRAPGDPRAARGDRAGRPRLDPGLAAGRARRGRRCRRRPGGGPGAAEEGFADRVYEADGSLRSRGLTARCTTTGRGRGAGGVDRPRRARDRARTGRRWRSRRTRSASTATARRRRDRTGGPRGAAGAGHQGRGARWLTDRGPYRARRGSATRRSSSPWATRSISSWRAGPAGGAAIDGRRDGSRGIGAGRAGPRGRARAVRPRRDRRGGRAARVIEAAWPMRTTPAAAATGPATRSRSLWRRRRPGPRRGRRAAGSPRRGGGRAPRRGRPQRPLPRLRARGSRTSGSCRPSWCCHDAPTPRGGCPPGSVAIAGDQTGVYPSRCPAAGT